MQYVLILNYCLQRKIIFYRFRIWMRCDNNDDGHPLDTMIHVSSSTGDVKRLWCNSTECNVDAIPKLMHALTSKLRSNVHVPTIGKCRLQYLNIEGSPKAVLSYIVLAVLFNYNVKPLKVWKGKVSVFSLPWMKSLPNSSRLTPEKGVSHSLSCTWCYMLCVSVKIFTDYCFINVISCLSLEQNMRKRRERRQFVRTPMASGKRSVFW